MAKIRSGATTDELTVDAASKAARTTLYDDTGNSIHAYTDIDGNRLLAVSIDQDVHVSIINSSEAPIINGSLFQGTSESTLGINLIQVNVFANQIMTLYVDQSMDGTNWDLVSLPYITSANAGIAKNYLATASYYRVRLINNSGGNATIVRLQTCLLPSGAGAQEIIRSPLMLAWEEMAGTANVESALTNFTIGTLGGASLPAATSYTVTAGRNLLVTGISLYYKSTNATPDKAIFRIRTAASGISNTSPIIWQFISVPSATVANNIGHSFWMNLGDGLKILNGQQITFTWNTSANGCTVGLSLIGYEI
jgi:hypothetical protein